MINEKRSEFSRCVIYTPAVSPSSDIDVPLCVDLDGTLLRTDSTWEAMALFLKRRPFHLFVLPFWLMRGKSLFKERLSASAALDVTILPYHETLLAFLREQHAQGRRLLLVTGASGSVARAVNDHLRLFDEVYATGEGINVIGERKASLLTGLFGEKGFDYIGNARADLKVWSVARRAIVVNAPRSVHRSVASLGIVEKEFRDRRSVFAAFLRAIRPYQWTKNVLIFVPVVTAHRLADQTVVMQAALAFLCFCCCTSCVYVLNDLTDLSSDRLHPRKRFRALAAGDLPIPLAVTGALLLFLIGILLTAFLPPTFLVVLLSYFILTTAYSFSLKQLAWVDVLVLAALYTLRIIAGHAATDLAYSVWLLLFSLFFFFSLALVKRYSELENLAREQRHAVVGRGYVTTDRMLVRLTGGISGIFSIVVLMLYITGDDVTRFYAQPVFL